MIRAAIIAASLLLLVGCQARPGAAPSGPGDFEVRLAVTPAPGDGTQRIPVPAEALAALRAPDRADLRVFDGQGRPLTMALVSADPAAAVQTVRLEALPILGTPDALAGEETELRIERRGGDRIATVLRNGAAADARPATLGVLFDTRALSGPTRSLTLDAVLPAQQPVDVLIEASDDLANWSRAGSRTLYRRSADAAGAIGSEAVALDGLSGAHRYLRVTWSSARPLLGPVEVRGAQATVESAAGAAALAAIATTPPRLANAHEVRFALACPAELAAVAIAPAGGEPLVPVRVLGRNGVDQPWTPLGAGDLRGAAPAPVALTGGAFREYRIEADARTPGFTAIPVLKLLYRPASLVVLFDGRPPYTLAAGAKGAENRFLEPERLIPRYGPGAEARLPLAGIAAAPDPRLTLAPGDEGLFNRKTALLWGLLLLGLAVLGVMVQRLWRPKAGVSAP
jgi:hypothetical protein